MDRICSRVISRGAGKRLEVAVPVILSGDAAGVEGSVRHRPHSPECPIAQQQFLLPTLKRARGSMHRFARYFIGAASRQRAAADGGRATWQGNSANGSSAGSNAAVVGERQQAAAQDGHEQGQHDKKAPVVIYREDSRVMGLLIPSRTARWPSPALRQRLGNPPRLSTVSYKSQNPVADEQVNSTLRLCARNRAGRHYETRDVGELK